MAVIKSTQARQQVMNEFAMNEMAKELEATLSDLDVYKVALAEIGQELKSFKSNTKAHLAMAQILMDNGADAQARLILTNLISQL